VPDGRTVQTFLSEVFSATEIARVAGEGIRREGFRRFDGVSHRDQGTFLADELIACDTIDSLLRTCAAFYTRDTFLYRRVNEFLRLGIESDRETGRNLGLYIGLLRECLCVHTGSDRLLWVRPAVVYRGANFSPDIVADYVRRPEEYLRWQSFSSASRDRRVALGFPGTVLFEISLTSDVPSMVEVSAFQGESEVILSPYQWFSLHEARWDSECRRWILSLGEQRAESPKTWFDDEIVLSSDDEI
jgi:hypothetical protein